jgi:hypothetical protein
LLDEKMGKADKRLRNWLENAPTDAPVDQVRSVLKRYFPQGHKEKPGSHIVAWDQSLIGREGFGPTGDFTIPVKGGQRVKGYYLERLARAIKIIAETE